MTTREAEGRAKKTAWRVETALKAVHAYGAARGDGAPIESAATFLCEALAAKDATLGRMAIEAERAKEELATKDAEIAALKAKVAGLAEDLKASQSRERAARMAVSVATAHRDDVWFWQADGANYPASLSCPVVMSADTLRSILAQATRLKAERDEAERLGRILIDERDGAREQRDAAVADNAAKQSVIQRAEVESQKRLEGGPWSQAGEAHLNALLAILQPAMLARHPGAALLEERNRDKEAIRALADVLEHTTHVAMGLHALYRQTATTESDGRHEALFSKNLDAVKAARKVLP